MFIILGHDIFLEERFGKNHPSKSSIHGFENETGNGIHSNEKTNSRANRIEQE